jgi:AraC-like DNA-binding protein
MKALLFKIPVSAKESFLVQEDKQPYFYDSLHFHPEYQLTLFLKGAGTEFVGDSIGRFQSGDLVLLGANLPHVFRCDEEYYQGFDLAAHSISVYFRHEALGRDFFQLPEMQAIRNLLHHSSRGLRWRVNAPANLADSFGQLLENEGFERLYGLLGILNQLTRQPSPEILSGISYSEPQSETDNERINRVFEFVIKHYDQPIRLEQAASLASMSETAFCRFFKLRTRKTFTEFVNEVRIGYACKRLYQQTSGISEIAYQCGFNNVAYFNRQFKHVVKLSPTAYREQFQKQEK